MKKITLCIALLIGFLTQAQWNTDTAVNALVVDSNTEDIQSIGTSDGQTYVVFWKSVPSPENFELRVQLLDASGNQQFGTDGTLISDTIPMNTFTNFWTVNIDSNDNLYVGVTGSGNESGWAYKVDITGAVLWTVTNPDSQLVKVLPLSSGDAIVAWLSTSSFSATMQKYDSNGNTVWTSVQSAAAPSAPAELYEISSGNYVMVYHQLASGINSTLYAQRFDTDGNAVWSNPTQLSNKTTAFNAIYDGTQDGDVIYFGYNGKSGNRFDSFLQRINPDGTLPWGINGSDFDTNETNYEQGTKIAYSSGSSYIWAVCNYRNTNQTESGEYVQKFDKTSGARQLSDTAKEVYAIGTDKIHDGDLQLVNDQPLFLIKSGINNGAAPVSLNACYLNTNGDFVWTEETKPVATFSEAKGRVQLNRPVNGQVVAVFTEDKGAGSKAYAQNFTDTALSVDEFNAQLLFQYVNPIQNELKLKSENQIQSVSVVNALGQDIVKVTTNSNEVIINSQSWETGMYFVNLTFNNGLSKGIKILKE